MKLCFLTKPQIIRRLILLMILCIIGFVAVCIRCNPKWNPAPQNIVIRTMPDSLPDIEPEGMTQETRILPPDGFTRIPAAEDSFLSYLRAMPLLEHGAELCTYRGDTLSAANAAAVYALDIGDEGFQQCADSIIRVYSEYYLAQNRPEDIAFHLSNGFLCDYESWMRGNRVLAFGDFTFWVKCAKPDDSYQTFRNYLVTVMRYAGTISLYDESTPITIEDAHTGDYFCRPGSPGHVILIVDEAVNADGERCFLLAQGAIPAQSFHILAKSTPSDSPWFSETELSESTLRLSGYTFESDALRRRSGGFPS
ncbi:MAG: DUF4846 domain-containing protein [Oscillospiraceae bacterium]|nr:DUF4846 domain-containing protein [Oscillospiraceae bacterium]